MSVDARISGNGILVMRGLVHRLTVSQMDISPDQPVFIDVDRPGENMGVILDYDDVEALHAFLGEVLVNRP